MACLRGDDIGDVNNAVLAARVLVGVAAGDSEKRRFIVTQPKKIRVTPLTPMAQPPAFVPDELIADILSRVTVKSLLRFRCVCKSWKSLISDPQFAKTHLHRSTMDTSFTHHWLVPQACFLRDDIVSCSVQSLFNNPITVPENLGHPLKPEYDVVGYCNGLFCLVCCGPCDGEQWSKKRVRLWNPCMRLMSQKSPPLFNRGYRYDRHRTVFGFGYDQSRDTYKVVSVFCDRSVKVFSFGTYSWREIQSFPAACAEWAKSGEFVSGTLNWLATRSVGAVSVDQYVIVSFDLGRETCRELFLPYDIDRNCCVAITLGVLRDCLYVSQNYDCNHFVVWQMVEYGVEKSWTRLLNISYMDLCVRAYAYLEPLCMSENGDVLMTTNLADGKVVLCNQRENRLERHEIQSSKSWFRSKVYVESLVSPCF